MTAVRHDVPSFPTVRPSGDTTGATDLAAITATLAAAGGANLATGTFYVSDPIVLSSTQHLIGAGIEATTIKLANGGESDVIQGLNVDSLIGGNTTGGIYGFSIRNLTIDGNKANNAAGTGINVYGRDYVIRDVRIKNCSEDGIYSEWSTDLSAPATGSSMEALLSGVKVHGCEGNGIHWNGPHDSQWDSVTVFSNAVNGVWVDASGGGLQVTNSHSWGNSQVYAWKLQQSTFLTGCIGEGASSAQVYLGFGNCSITGGHYFAGGASTPVGIEIAGGPTQWTVDTEISSCTSGALKFTSDGGGGKVIALVNQSSGTVVSGTISATTSVEITGPTFVGKGGGLQDVWMRGLGLKSWNYNPQNITTQTAATSQTVYAVAIPLKAGQLATNIVLDVEVAAAGTAPTGFYVGLATSAGVMLAQSGNLKDSASLTNQGLREFALSAAYLVQTNGLYYVVFLQNGAFGTTNPSFGRGTGRFLVNVSGVYMAGTAGTGQTALPANGASMASTIGGTGVNYWAGVS